ncbi:MAG: patatin-like phospholipase family protein [Acidobacteria bacterium]|nr:patatin-like phospholipase family protein [Acidobacteriota bacterium]
MNRCPKLGLALSGGGFRASFFHLGVLKRLAELDLLRHVNVLSTVSGGSIIGAHYFLHLKGRLESSGGPLARSDYVELIENLEEEFRRGVSLNLRTRLVRNPLANLRMLCGRHSLGRQMAMLYSILLYGDVVRAAFPNLSWTWRKGVPLRSMKFLAGHRGLVADLEGYNAKAPDKIPKFVLNSTCLNTGRPFRFTLAEVGDPQLGFIRLDEVTIVLRYKQLLALTERPEPPDPSEGVRIIAEHAERKTSHAGLAPAIFGTYTASHLVWWLAVQEAMDAEAAQPAAEDAGEKTFRTEKVWGRLERTQPHSPVVAFLRGDWDASRRLAAAEFGTLRRVKLSAWYLQDAEGWKEQDLRDGSTREEHEDWLWNAVEDIDVPMADRLRARFGPGTPDRAAFFEFVLDLYYTRSAEAFAWTAEHVLERLTLSDAVAASANFPPVFRPYKIFGLYDKNQVRLLSLTDGGVWDNQGIQALVEERCTHLIVSDAGGLLDEQRRCADSRSGMMTRIINVMMSNVRDLQLESLRERRRVSEGIMSLPDTCLMPPVGELSSRYDLKAVAFFHMNSNPNDGEPASGGPPALRPHPQAPVIANLRTDLDAFSSLEADALIYQGYQLADRFVRKFVYPAFSSFPPDPPRPPVELSRTVRAAVVLKAGRRRFFRLIVLYPLASRAGLALSGLAVLWFVGRSQLSLVDFGRGIVHLLRTSSRPPWLPYSVVVPLESKWSALVTLLFLVSIGALWKAWPQLEEILARFLARTLVQTPRNPREALLSGVTVVAVALILGMAIHSFFPGGLLKGGLWMFAMWVVVVALAIPLALSLRSRVADILSLSHTVRPESLGAQAKAARVAEFIGLWRQNILWLLWYLPLILAVLAAWVANLALWFVHPLVHRAGRR